MNKEKRNREMQQVEEEGRQMGILAFLLVSLFITTISFFQRRKINAPFAMIHAFIAAEAYPKYRFTRKKLYLSVSILNALSSAIHFIEFVIEKQNKENK